MNTATDELIIFEKIKGLLVEQGYDAEAISPDISFSNDLSFDSLDTAEFIMQMEVLFDVAIPYGEIEDNCNTMKELVRTIHKHVLSRVQKVSG